LENEQPSNQPGRQWRLPRPGATDRTEPARQKTPINLRREPHQRMAKVDDLLQSGTKQIVLAVVAWLAHGCPLTANPAREGITNRSNLEYRNARKQQRTIAFLQNRILAQVKSRR